ncbi:DedA family protein [Niallia oryzisoli]|uniref:DedA family protein n=1 Tax=Niallia oryzisoli TaxID=1737571 RepID=A0ABZ2CKV9_9BACI
MTLMESLVEHYGYLIIFIVLILGIVGLPMPDEVFLTYVGYNVFLGKMSLSYALLIAMLGSIIGISISYLLGHKLGLPFIRRFGPKVKISEKNINWVQKRFHKYGGLFLLSGYFLPGVRHVTAYVAGITTYRYLYFAIFAYLGAVIWVSFFIMLGNILGSNWEIITHYLPHFSKMLWILLFIGFVYFFISYRLSNKKY